MVDTLETRLKRLRMRSWRRGTKEMDLILGGFSDAHLTDLDQALLASYEALLEENDNDLYDWTSGRCATPERFSRIVGRVRQHRGSSDGTLRCLETWRTLQTGTPGRTELHRSGRSPWK